ncbi:MAG TPA: hypothetical protein VF337_01475, partial [Candidatus Limnocylindrales bacterium]
AIRALVNPVAAVALLDEDDVGRAIFDATLASGAAASPSVERLSAIARILAHQGLVVVVTTSDPPAATLLWNRANLPGYREIHLRASAETIKHRNRRHRIDHRTGAAAAAVGTAGAAGAAARAPETAGPPTAPAIIRTVDPAAPSPDLSIDMNNPEPPELLAFRVAVLIPEFVVAAAGAASAGTNRFRRGA